jgi:hypothetical protein
MKEKISHEITITGPNGEDSSIEIEIPKFESQSAEDLFDNHKSEVYSSIVVGITRMMNLKLDRIACFAIEDLIFELGKESSVDNLTRCIDYYISIEEFETCAYIQNKLLPYVKN